MLESAVLELNDGTLGQQLVLAAIILIVLSWWWDDGNGPGSASPEVARKIGDTKGRRSF